MLTVIVLATAGPLPSNVFGSQIEKRVVFRKGAAVFSGKLPRDPDYNAYFFPAKKAQTLTVKLISDDPEAYIAIYETKQLGPDEDTILANAVRSRQWSGRLPVSGEYSVQVYDPGENGLNRFSYKLEISLR
jgi:hypothetical protein